MKPSWYLSRRTVLRSAGASVALPCLDAMVRPGRAGAAAPAARRFIGMWILPAGVVSKRDSLQNCRVAPWTPAAAGPLAGMTPDKFLKPFYDRGLQSKITILTGLTFKQSTGHYPGPLMSPVSCRRLPDNSGSVPDGPRGPTLDQVLGDHFKQQSPALLKSLVVSSYPYVTYAGKVDTAMLNNISWGATEAIPPETNPRAVFESLFGAGAVADTPAAKAELARRQLYDQSLLDGVRKDASRLAGRLGSRDRERLDQYLTGVREMEEQLRAAPPVVTCSRGATPAEPASTYFAKAMLDVRVKDMTDLIVKAFECDRTRVASFMYTRSHGSVNGYPHLGLGGQHHSRTHYRFTGYDLTEEQNVEWMAKYTSWALDRYAYLLKELDTRVSPDGTTILDNTLVFTSNDNTDGQDHTIASMPIILGGRGGRAGADGWSVNAGRHVRYPAWRGDKYEQINRVAVKAGLPPWLPEEGERTVRDLQLGILRTMGVNATRWGDATKPIDLSWADAVAS